MWYYHKIAPLSLTRFYSARASPSSTPTNQPPLLLHHVDNPLISLKPAICPHSQTNEPYAYAISSVSTLLSSTSHHPLPAWLDGTPPPPPLTINRWTSNNEIHNSRPKPRSLPSCHPSSRPSRASVHKQQFLSLIPSRNPQLVPGAAAVFLDFSPKDYQFTSFRSARTFIIEKVTSGSRRSELHWGKANPVSDRT